MGAVILVSALLAIIWQIYNEGWGYIYGASGQVWTAAKQAAAARETTVRYGKQWIGKRVIDCSGIAYYAFRKLGGNMYHGSNTIWNKYVTGRSELRNGQRTDGGELLPGDPVFKRRKENGTWNRHHIGYYVGNGRVIEAKSTRYGVVISGIEAWHETAHWKNVQYEGGVIFMGYPTLRKGDSGSDVKELQMLLNQLGYGLDVDGKFGEKTRNAVKMFQASNSLQADGVAGDQTWAALMGNVKPPQAEQLEGTVFVSLLKMKEMQACLNDCLSIIKSALE